MCGLIDQVITNVNKVSVRRAFAIFAREEFDMVSLKCLSKNVLPGGMRHLVIGASSNNVKKGG